jgi:predicted DNA-binding protein (MmcQ/YjbR family)
MNRTRPSAAVVRKLRSICLSFPEAEEKPFGGHLAPSFRVRDRLFVMLAEDGRSFTAKAAPGGQHLLVASDPGRYFIPPYVGSKRWIGVRLDTGVDWAEVAEVVEDSYRLIAPKRLVDRFDGRGAVPPPSV